MSEIVTQFVVTAVVIVNMLFDIVIEITLERLEELLRRAPYLVDLLDYFISAF